MVFQNSDISRVNRALSGISGWDSISSVLLGFGLEVGRGFRKNRYFLISLKDGFQVPNIYLLGDYGGARVKKNLGAKMSKRITKQVEFSPAAKYEMHEENKL